MSLARLLEKCRVSKHPKEPGPVISMKLEHYRMSLPPKVALTNTWGVITDARGIPYLGYNGRSSILGNRVYFSLNDPTGYDAPGNPAAARQHHVAVLPNPMRRPLAGAIAADGRAGLLELTAEERNLEMTTDSRVLLAPGGIAENSTLPTRGYIWYQKWIRGTNLEGELEDEYQGTGIAAIRYIGQGGAIVASREGRERVLFGKYQPSFGTFCVIQDKDWFYVFGTKGTRVYVARTPESTPSQSHNYEYWDGDQWSLDINSAVPVLSGYVEGTIYRSSMFGEPYEWVFVGRSERGARNVDIGLAHNIWGPYTVAELLTSEQLGHPIGTNFYVHPWAFREDIGELLATWKDEASGMIVGSKLYFQMLHRGAWVSEISLEDMHMEFTNMVLARHDIIRAIAVNHWCWHEICLSHKNRKAIIRLVAHTPAPAENGAEMLRQLIKNWKYEVRHDNLDTKLRQRGLLSSKEI